MKRLLTTSLVLVTLLYLHHVSVTPRTWPAPKLLASTDVLSVYEYRGLRVPLDSDTELSMLLTFGLSVEDEVRRAVDAYMLGQTLSIVRAKDGPRKLVRMTGALEPSVLYVVYAFGGHGTVMAKTDTRAKGPWDD